MQSKTFGNIGESLAYNFLKNKGYEIIESNYTSKVGEIDIIAKDGDYIVFVEVKTRSSNKYGLGREAVDFRKQNKIRLVATNYLKHKKLTDSYCRFDVVEINSENNIEHIENAF